MFWTIVFILIGIGVYIWIKQSKATERKFKELNETLRSIPDFNVTQQLIGAGASSAIAIDENQKEICLIGDIAINDDIRIFNYDEILSSEVIEDGDTITSTSRSSQAGGAIVGGLLFGGLGAVVGGLSGKTKSTSTVKDLKLRVTVKDTRNPVQDIKLISTECKKGDVIYNMAIKNADHWHGLMNVLMKMADSELKQQVPQINNQASNTTSLPASTSDSVADEILKLAKLKQAGVITDEEFLQQKQKILNR